jgi:hypothetical protein
MRYYYFTPRKAGTKHCKEGKEKKPKEWKKKEARSFPKCCNNQSV